jgi:hypothetical protein
VTDRIEPVGRRRDLLPVEPIVLSPVERERRRREREERTPPPPDGGEGDDAPPRLDLRA